MHRRVCHSVNAEFETGNRVPNSNLSKAILENGSPAEHLEILALTSWEG